MLIWRSEKGKRAPQVLPSMADAFPALGPFDAARAGLPPFPWSFRSSNRSHRKPLPLDMPGTRGSPSVTPPEARAEVALPEVVEDGDHHSPLDAGHDGLDPLHVSARGLSDEEADPGEPLAIIVRVL